MEQPIERYERRISEAVNKKKKLLEPLEKEIQEIEQELEAAQSICGTKKNPHLDDGGMFEGCCIKCGKMLG